MLQNVSYKFAEYISARAVLKQLPGSYKLTELGVLLTEPLTNGIFKRPHEFGSGMRLVNVYDLFQSTSIIENKLDRVPVSENEYKRFNAKKGDIFFCRSSIKPEGVGWSSYLEDEQESCVFECHLIRARVNNQNVIPAYLSNYLRTDLARKYILAHANVTTMATISQGIVESFPVVIPPIEIQSLLVAELNSARDERDRALSEAEKLLETFDSYLLSSLGLALADENTRQSFAVKLGTVRGQRLDPPAYQPLVAKGKIPSVPLVPLESLAAINNHSVDKPDDESLVPYIGLPECDQTEVREVVLRPYKEVKGRSVIRPGDILFARIEPSIFNKKYVLVEDLKGYDYAYTSTEFYVVTPRSGVSNLEYLYAMFFCSFVYAQSKGMTTGSSGRRRLDPSMFRSLKIPAPGIVMQKQIAEEAITRRNRARELRIYAENVWNMARARFEQQLLQGGNS